VHAVQLGSGAHLRPRARRIRNARQFADVVMRDEDAVHAAGEHEHAHVLVVIER
jgi:hypothetical protein